MLFPPPDGDQNRGYRIAATHTVLLAVSAVLLFARLFTRAFVKNGPGLDDLFIFVGAVSNIL